MSTASRKVSGQGIGIFQTFLFLFVVTYGPYLIIKLLHAGDTHQAIPPPLEDPLKGFSSSALLLHQVTENINAEHQSVSFDNALLLSGTIFIYFTILACIGLILGVRIRKSKRLKLGTYEPVKWQRQLIFSASIMPYLIAIAANLYLKNVGGDIVNTGKLISNKNTYPSVIIPARKVTVRIDYTPAVTSGGVGAYNLSSINVTDFTATRISGSVIELTPIISVDSAVSKEVNTGSSPDTWKGAGFLFKNEGTVTPYITLQLPNDDKLNNSLISGKMTAMMDYIIGSDRKSIDIKGQFRFWVANQEQEDFALQSVEKI
jgi:hypothetical protein